MTEAPTWGAGSIQAIVYAIFQVVDEISHAVGLDNFEIGYRLCQWSHRYDLYQLAPHEYGDVKDGMPILRLRQ